MKYFKVILIFTVLVFISCSEIEKVTIDTVIEDVKVQPKEAYEIAEKHLENHGTRLYENIYNKTLKVHIFRKGNYYYIKKSNYPAIGNQWYTESCIRVSAKNGEVKYID